MKILHMIAGAPTGGAETFSMDAIRALDEQGVKQKVLCRPHESFINTLKPRGIEYSHYSYNRLKKFFEKTRIKKEIEEFKPDLVHCWMSRASSFAPANFDIPVLGWFGGPYKLKNYKNCGYYMGVTKDIVRHIIRETGEPHHSFVVHTFGTLEEDEPVTKADFDIPADAKVVLLLSRMHWKKGVDTLLEAALQVEDAYFLLAGDGPDLEKYKALCSELGLDDRVRFPGWRTDRSALLDIADVCVLPSRYEPFGTVIAEAWFAEVPLVATRADGARQYVTHKEDGLLSDIDNVDALAGNLQKALHDKNVRKSLVKGGKETYNALFSKEVVTKELLGAYQDIRDMYHTPEVVVDTAHMNCPPDFRHSLEEALASLDIESGIDRDGVYDVAAAYIENKSDGETVTNACYIQATGLFDFFNGAGNSKVRVLPGSAIERIIANEELVQSRSFYTDFKRSFQMPEQAERHGT